MSDKSSTKHFIEKSNKVHSNLYSYTLTEYVNAKTKVTITCKEHGDFEQKPNNHLSGQGCPKCKPKIVRSTTKQFIQKANNIHGDIYKYNSVEYINSRKKVEIFCLKHGIFYQTPNNHLKGKGCPKCAHENSAKLNKENPTGWSYSNWKKAGERSKNFDSFKVYIIKCWNDEEEFYKIGKTFMTVDNRFTCQQIPYNYEVLKTYVGDAREICKLERQLQKLNKQFKYSPKNKFDGMHECFSKLSKNGL